MKHASTWIGVALAAAFTGSLARAQTTELVSVDSGGAQGDDLSSRPSNSPDGRFVAFQSRATNLVTGDTNGTWDVFVRDRLSGTTERVSLSTGGAEGDSDSQNPSISADGRFVAFRSIATNLVAGDTNGFGDVFVRDRQGGTTERVSLSTSGAQGNHDSGDFGISISADGNYVAFTSSASTLVASDTNGGFRDTFVRDRQAGTTELVSLSTSGAQGNQHSSSPSISADGRFVAFASSATNLVAGDTNNDPDIFVRDRQSGTTERVNLSSSGQQGGNDSGRPSISADGRYVAFDSRATGFTDDGNTDPDVFVRDRQSGTTELMSVSIIGSEGNSSSWHSSISPDGRYVAFFSAASDLVAGMNGGIFVRDRLGRTTERVSLAGDYPSISANGRYVAFESVAILVVPDTNGTGDVFVRDRGLPPIVAHCFGSFSQCPCHSSGLPGRGCDNSADTGGALLSSSGTASLSSDTVVLTSSGEKPTAVSIFLQGSSLIGPVAYGDGLRCIGGTLRRLYTVTASGGVVTAPMGSQPSISARSAALGDPISTGEERHYQTYYRDGVPGFCPSPAGNTWNVSNARTAVWSP